MSQPPPNNMLLNILMIIVLLSSSHDDLLFADVVSVGMRITFLSTAESVAGMRWSDPVPIVMALVIISGGEICLPSVLLLSFKNVHISLLISLTSCTFVC